MNYLLEEREGGRREERKGERSREKKSEERGEEREGESNGHVKVLYKIYQAVKLSSYVMGTTNSPSHPSLSSLH